MGHVILFDKGYFHGEHKHVFEDYKNLNGPGDDHFNDKGTKSIVVLEGVWEFFKDWNYEPDNPSLGMLGPGLYHTVAGALGGLAKDQITSLREVVFVGVKAARGSVGRRSARKKSTTPRRSARRTMSQ